MKKALLLALNVIFLNSCSQTQPFLNTQEEDIKEVKRVYKGEIDAIRVSTSIDAEVIKSNDERVELVGEDKDLQYVVVELQNGDLRVYQESKNSVFSFSKDNQFKVKIYVKDFEKIKADSSADILIKDKFTQSKVDVQASSSGSIKGDLEANIFTINTSSSGEFKGNIWAVDLDAKLSSSGDVKVKGKTKKAVVRASSSADFDGKELEASFADLSASSSADIQIKVIDEVEATASSSADVEIYGGPNLVRKNIQESSSGSVEFK